MLLQTTLADILGDILPAFSNKNPQVKEGACKFLTRCLSTSKHAIPPAQVKPTSEAIAVLLEDSYAGARDEAANAFGTLMKMVGERPLGAVMDGLADVRKAKVKEAHEKATVKAKAGSGNPPKPAPATSKGPAKKVPAVAAKKEELPPPPEGDDATMPEKKSRGPPARLTAKKAAPSGASAGANATPAAPAPSTSASAKKLPPAAAAAAAAATSSKPTKGGPAPPGALDTVKYKHTPEDAEALAAEVIPSNFITDLGDANWKTRLAALEEMTTWVESMVEELDAEVVVRALGKKGWGEKNFQVSAKLYGILVILAERCPSFGRSSVALSVPHLSEKLGDAKLKKPASETLATFAEKTSLQFVLNQGMSYSAFLVLFIDFCVPSV